MRKKTNIELIMRIISTFLLIISMGVIVTSCDKILNMNSEKEIEQPNSSSMEITTDITTDITTNTTNNEAEESNSSSEEKPEIKKLDASKDLVYTSLNATSNEYSYDLPTINIDSTDVTEINRKIQKDYLTKINEEITNDEQGLSVVMISLKYDSYINNNILSLVIDHAISANDLHYYDVYNVDIYTGKSIDNIDLLKYKNIDETNFLNTLTELYKNKFVELYGSKDSYIENLRNAPSGWTEEGLKEQDAFYTEQYNKTIDANNCSVQTPIFLNSNNNISVIAKIYAIAGGDSYNYVLDTGL
ncbi:MAG: hypothetical protein FWC47_10990 [Oscillospiraceae bacterium]|nr:hypothetical protein [Oscillospiraceae bacterium]